MHAHTHTYTRVPPQLRENVEQAAQQCTFTDVPNRSSLEDNQQLALQLQQHWGYTGDLRTH
jgi:hypothetical protein